MNTDQYDDDIDDDEINEDSEHEFGCCFPDRCLMPSYDHLRSECFDAEMAEAMHKGESQSAPTAPTPPLPLDLLAKATEAIIRKRYAAANAESVIEDRRPLSEYFSRQGQAEAALLAADVPGLLAEVERLKCQADDNAALTQKTAAYASAVIKERDEAQRAAALHRDLDNFNHALLEKARAEIDQLRAEQADNLRAAQSIAAELVAQRDEARAALAFLMRDVDAVAGVSNKDRYDFAVDVARERGHEEPTAEDELDGFLRLIAEARRVLGSKEGA